MSTGSKQEIVTFKADRSLLESLRGVHNRSEFIRNAIMAALESTCPLCGGTGILTPEQQQHWQAFQRSHGIEQCSDCQAVYLVCEAAARRGTGCATE